MINNEYINYIDQLKNALDALPISDISKTAKLIENSYKKGKQIFIVGNGGSAATASHMACDLQKTTLHKNYAITKRIKAICLNDNIPLITAWSNDFSYAESFCQQLKVLGNKGDLLIVITASGNSENILKILKTASSMGVKNVALLGFNGGKAKNLADSQILVKSDHYGIVEDAHIIIVHMMTEYLKKVVQANVKN
jgi:D-sedoheptulose 7-phosphate isomerase